MKNGISVVAGVLFLPLVFGIGVAQQAPGSAADANNPSGPPGPMQTTSIWKVDPLTGALTLNIPLTKPLPGGRGPHYGHAVLYNSASTITLQFQGMNGNLASYLWVGANQSWASFAPNGPWEWNGPIIRTNPNQQVADIPIQEMENANLITVGWIQGCTITGPALYEDANGATHDLNVVNLTLNTTNYPNYTSTNPQCSYNNTTSSSTIDGSALQTSLSQNTPSAIESDGTSITGTQLEDSNGNVNNLQDSEGRTEQLGNWSCYPFMSAQTCNYTAYGPSGASLSYSISSESIAIGDFQMPHPQSTEITTPFLGPSGNVAGIQLNDDPKNTTVTGVSSITYPDTTSYRFGYTPNQQCANQVMYGTVTSITFPAGGSVEFCWAIRNIGQTASTTVTAESTLVVTDVYVSSGNGNASHWRYSYPDFANGTLSSTETAPDGTVTTYSSNASFIFSTVFNHGVAGTFQETKRDITGTGGHLRTITTSYYGSGLPQQVTTTYWDVSNAPKQTVQYSYDGSGNVTEKDESDLYTGTSIPWLRKTFMVYAYSQPYCPQTGPSGCPTGTAASFVNANIVNKPSQVTIADGNGNPYSIAQFGYDETAVSSITGVLNHDDVSFGGNKEAGRGNLTSEAHCAAISGGNCTSWLITKHTYDSTGQRLSTTDPKGNNTSFSYGDSFWAAPPSGGAGSPGSEGSSFIFGTSSSPTNSFLTGVTHPNQATDSYTYDYYTGEETSHTDWSTQQTKYLYVDPSSGSADPFSRLRQIIAPKTSDGTPGTGGTTSALTTFYYNDSPGAFSIEEKQTVNSLGSSTDSTSYFDGLGRKTTTKTVSPSCSSLIEIDTVYDVMSRVETVSNPYCSSNDPTSGLTTFLYDALGRKYQITAPDGAVTTIAYAGNATEFTDPSNGTTTPQHIQQVDGLGRLLSVCEVTSSAFGSPSSSNCGLNLSGTGYLTSYSYDPLNNLLTVSQHGVSRWFTYDPMSRLTQAMNPETGSTANVYSYTTSSSGVCAGDPSVPCSKTDARGVITTYNYDKMSRLLSKIYSGNTASTPIACYQYDTSSVSGAGGNLTGHLTNAWTQAASSGSCASGPNTFLTLKSFLSFDALGRPTSARQQSCVAGNCTTSNAPQSYQTGMSYDLAGNETTLTNPVGANNQALTLTNYFDSASRPCLTTSSWTANASPNLFQVNPTASSNSPGYSPGGGLQNFFLGSTSSTASTGCGSAPASPVNEVLGYNKRFWVNSISATGQIP